MVNNFFPELQNPSVGLRFWFYIQGIPYFFTDGALPVNRNGTAFPATMTSGIMGTLGTYPAASTFTIKENTFDLSRSLSTVGSDISRRTGTTQPGSMRLTVRDDGSDFLTELFAVDLSDANTTEINRDFSLTDTTLYVDDHDDFASSGTLYIGKETVTYTGKAGSSGTDARFTGVARNQCALLGNSVYYEHEDYAASAPRTISTNPRSWVGRYVRVFAVIVDEFGRAMNIDWRNSSGYAQEIFRGILDSGPRPMDDFTRWTLSIRGLEALLDTEVGGDYPEGQMINVPGNKSKNQSGWIDPLGQMKGNFAADQIPIIVMDGSNKVHMEIYRYANSLAAQGTAGPTATHDYTGDDAATVVASLPLSDLDSDLVGSVSGWNQIQQEIAAEINGRIAAAGYGALVHAKIYSGGADGPWGIKLITLQGTAAEDAFKFIFHWDADDSVSQLIGATKPTTVLVFCDSEYSTVAALEIEHTDRTVVGIVSEHATQLIYWLKPQDAGIQRTTPSAANGFVLVGEKEVVKYEADVDIPTLKGDTAALYWEGMRVLKGCTRGMFGTPKTRHILTIDDMRKANADPVKMQFGIGADAQSWTASFLEIAHSTGTASHNGAFDVRDKEGGASISDDHFDVPSFVGYAESAGDPLEKNIDFFSAESMNLKGWIESFLKPRMCFITAASCGNNNYEHKLRIVEIRPALESESVVSFGEDDIDFYDPASFRQGNNRIVNRIRCHYRWDYAQNKEEPDQVIVTSWDSVQDHGGVKAITWKLRGQSWTYSDAYSRVSMWALRAFQRWSHDYDIVNLRVNRKGLLVAVGDTVEVTLSGLPTKDGSRGFSNQKAVCIRADHTWHDPQGTPSSLLTLVIEQDQRYSTYCPTCKVHSTTTIDGDPGIRLESSEFSPDGSNNADASFFTAGDKIVIHNRGNYATRDERTIASITTEDSGGTTYDVFILNSGLTNAVLANGAFVMSQQYDDAGTEQKKHVYIASDANVLSEANTESFKYS